MNNIAVYESRSDGDFDLVIVLSAETVQKQGSLLPKLLFSLGKSLEFDNGILVSHTDCNFPDVWDGSNLDSDDINKFSILTDGTIQISHSSNVPTVYGFFGV